MSSVCLHSYLCHGRGQICSFLRQSLWLQCMHLRSFSQVHIFDHLKHYLLLLFWLINEIVCASVPNDRWGELDSGQTTIAFTRLHQHETDELTGSVQTPSSPQRQPIEVCFAYADVDAAYKVRLGII